MCSPTLACLHNLCHPCVCMFFQQVSNQCMALVRDDCLVPTLDDPSLGYVKESSSSQYVPDVFYKVLHKLHCHKTPRSFSMFKPLDGLHAIMMTPVSDRNDHQIDRIVTESDYCDCSISSRGFSMCY